VTEWTDFRFRYGSASGSGFFSASSPRRLLAAECVRMSTEHQQYILITNVRPTRENITRRRHSPLELQPANARILRC
jgi:hypothetical protein